MRVYDHDDHPGSGVSARGALGSILNTIYIEKMTIRVIKKPPELVYRRPLTVGRFDGLQQDQTVDRIIQSTHYVGDSKSGGYSGRMTRGVFSGLAGGYLRPSASPLSRVDLPNSSYAVGWIWVTSRGINQAYELVCITFDADAIMLRNGVAIGIDPKALITVNNVIQLRVLREGNAHGPTNEVHRFSHSSDMVTDPYFDSHRSLNFQLQTPASVIQQAQSNRIGDIHRNGNHARAASTFVTTTPKPAPMAYRSPAQFIADTANAYVNSLRMSEDTYAASDNPYEDDDLRSVNNMSSAASLLGHSPFATGSFRFQSALSEVNGGLGGDGRSGLFGGMFDWAELLEIDPRFRNFDTAEMDRVVDVIIPENAMGRSDITTETRHSDRTNWSGTGDIHATAMMLGSITLSVMFELGVSTALFVVTNETLDGNFRCEMQGGSCLSFISDAVNYYEASDKFMTRIETEVAPDCAATGDGRFNEFTATVDADVLGEVYIAISMNGSPVEEFPLDSGFSSRWTPLVTETSTGGSRGASTLHNIAATVASIFDATHKQQQDTAVNMLRSRAALTNTNWK